MQADSLAEALEVFLMDTVLVSAFNLKYAGTELVASIDVRGCSDVKI